MSLPVSSSAIICGSRLLDDCITVAVVVGALPIVAVILISIVVAVVLISVVAVALISVVAVVLSGVGLGTEKDK